jgi:hypothetical protein
VTPFFWGHGNRKGVLWGRRSGKVIDSRDQIGVYVLYDEARRAIYIGQAGQGNQKNLELDEVIMLLGFIYVSMLDAIEIAERIYDTSAPDSSHSDSTSSSTTQAKH